MSKQGNGFALDDDVKSEIESAGGESDLMGAWVTDKQGGDKLPLVENWLPDNDEWQGKTVVNDREARLFAIARNLTRAYPEIQSMDPFISGLFRDLEMYLTSRDGLSREQQMRVLMSMFGGSIDDDETRGMLMGMLGAGNDDDD